MKNLHEQLTEQYIPEQALVFFRNGKRGKQGAYVELYDIGSEGEPYNARPLSSSESNRLATLLLTSKENSRNFLQPRNVFDPKLLYTDLVKGFAVWYTAAGKRDLLFSDDLEVPNGKAEVPALLWKATEESLYIYALPNNKRPDRNTILCHAPFFNIYDDGRVCTGTVEINFSKAECLEDFTKIWEANFFESYFSHMIAGQSPVKKNIVQLWKTLIASNKPFPNKELRKCGISLQTILI